MSTPLIQGPGNQIRRVFLGLIVALIAVNMLVFFPSSNPISARYEALENAGSNDVFHQATTEQTRENGRFGLAVWLSRHAQNSVIYRGVVDDVVDREISQNLLGVGRAKDVIEVRELSPEILDSVDYNALIVASAEPYKRSGTQPLTTGKPWAIALDPQGDHLEFVLVEAPLDQYDGEVGVLLIEASALPRFSGLYLVGEVSNGR